MVVLFLIFLIQFSCSCAALAINEHDEKMLIEKADKVYEAPTAEDQAWTVEHKVFDNRPDAECYHFNTTMNPKCQTCFSIISDKVNSGFNAAGGLGLFFSFTELFGGIVACRYRNLMDPLASGLTGTPFAGGI